VAVVYYLCHLDGHLDHPHFLEMELLVSSSHRTGGLYLRDFTARLDALRGSGMPAMYAWSAKRSYRNGYVWQDLAEDDLVHPAHGAHEYVLKGSPLVLFSQQPPPPALRDASSSTSYRRRKNWSSFDLREYGNSKLAALQRAGAGQQQSAATQTDHRRGPDLLEESTELAIDEISPPPSSSSPDDSCGREVGVITGGRMRVSAMLMQLFSCGSMRGHARGRSDLPTTSAGGSSRHAAEKEADAYITPARADCSSSCGGEIGTGVGDVTERDYFSGSLVESSSSNKTRSGGDAAHLLKRSSSCDADRGAAKLKVPVVAREHVVRAGCLASRGRGTRAAPAKKGQTKSTAAAESKVEGGECTKGGATTEPADEAGGIAS
jgi:hypothetical protein